MDDHYIGSAPDSLREDCASSSPAARRDLACALVDELPCARRARRLRRARRRRASSESRAEHPGTLGIVGDIARQGRDPSDRAAGRSAGSAASTCWSTTRRASARCRWRRSPTPSARTSSGRSRRTSLGPFRLTKALLGALAASAREGRGRRRRQRVERRRGQRVRDWGAYGASKAALRHMTRIWDEELAAARRPLPVARPGRHGHAAARARGARRRSARRCSARRSRRASIVDAIVARCPRDRGRIATAQRTRSVAHDRRRSRRSSGPLPARLLVVDADGSRDAPAARALARLAAAAAISSSRTTPPRCPRASPAFIVRTGQPIEVRLAAWRSPVAGDASRVRRRRLRRRRLPHAHRGSAAAAARLPPATGWRSGRCRRPSRIARPSALRARCASMRRARAFWQQLARHGRPIQYAHIAEPLALWDAWTPIAARAGRVRAAVGGLRHRMARRRGDARARHRLRDADARRRPVVDRRCDARPPLAARRVVPDLREHRARDRDRRARTDARHRDRHDGRARRRACGEPPGGVRAARAAGNAADRAHHAGCASSMRSSPARTSPGAATTSCCARSLGRRVLAPPTRALERDGFRTHEFGDSMLVFADARSRPRRASLPASAACAACNAFSDAQCPSRAGRARRATEQRPQRVPVLQSPPDAHAVVVRSALDDEQALRRSARRRRAPG